LIMDLKTHQGKLLAFKESIPLILISTIFRYTMLLSDTTPLNIYRI
jgi:hypothetical protein